MWDVMPNPNAIVYLSERHGAPVLIWPVHSPTTKSAMKQSSVSPERWDTMVPQPIIIEMQNY